LTATEGAERVRAVTGPLVFAIAAPIVMLSVAVRVTEVVARRADRD
jgi:hypothetical protein